jgi:hypothetical protein
MTLLHESNPNAPSGAHATAPDSELLALKGQQNTPPDSGPVLEETFQQYSKKKLSRPQLLEDRHQNIESKVEASKRTQLERTRILAEVG